VIQIVLDASALLAMLRGEPGGNAVAESLDNSAMLTVNLAEVVGFYARRGSGEGETRRLLTALPTQIYDLDADLAYTVGLLVPMTMKAGLSFGDRACLSLARRLRTKAMTADRSWSRIAQAVGVEVELIR
jgi:PIN domain nuclease of toxin-antitoxin system